MTNTIPTTKSYLTAGELLKDHEPSPEEVYELTGPVDRLRNALDEFCDATPERVHGSGSTIELVEASCHFQRAMLDQMTDDPEATKEALSWYYCKIAHFAGLHFSTDPAALHALLGATRPHSLAT